MSFEIAGFAWFHGWNDGLSSSSALANRYEQNMAQFIRQIRTYYETRSPGKIKAKAPFVIATAAFEGWNETYLNQYPTRRAVLNAQHAMMDAARYAEFAGNVKTMEARGYWRDIPASHSSTQGYHYNRNAETFMLVGDALGRGMVDLLNAATPDTLPPAITGLNPFDNATGVAVVSNLVLTFNEPIALGSGNITIRNLSNSTQTTIPVTDGTKVSLSGSVLSVNPSAKLAGNSNLAIRIDAGVVKDPANNGNWGSQWGSGASGYQFVSASGTTITPAFNTASGGNIHIVAAEFKASEITPNAYAVWSAQYPSADLTDPSADNDKGSLPAGIEWVLGGDPTNSSDDAGLAPSITTGPNGKLNFTYRRRDAANTDPNTTIAVEYGGIHTGWTTAIHQGTGANQITIAETPGDPGFSNVTVALPGNLAVSGKLFARLKAVVVTP